MIEIPQEPIVDLSSMTHTLAQSIPTLAMSWNPILTNILVGVFLVVSGAMILLVLIQRPQGGGLSGAFGAGGGGAGQTAFGTKTGDVLTIATVTIFGLFLVTAIVLNFATRPQSPADPMPAITLPAGETGEMVEDAIDDEPVENASELIDDAMESTPELETGTGEDVIEDAPEAPTSDEPASGEEQPT